MELELKYRADKDYEDLLLDKGFKYQKSAHQKDIYYLSGETIGEYPIYLRLREDIINSKYSFDFHEYIKESVTKETEVELSSIRDIAKFMYILDGLGYKEKCTINKKRKVFAKDEFKVITDFVESLGHFVEVELEAENTEENLSKLKTFAQKLGLKDEDIVIGMGYPELFLEKNK